MAVKVHESWEAFEKYFADQDGPKRLVAFTKFGRTPHCAPAFSYEKGDWLIFGSETSGLPDAAHEVRSLGCAANSSLPIRARVSRVPYLPPVG